MFVLLGFSGWFNACQSDACFEVTACKLSHTDGLKLLEFPLLRQNSQAFSVINNVSPCHPFKLLLLNIHFKMVHML